MQFPNNYNNLAELLIKGTMQEFLLFCENNGDYSAYQVNNWVNIKIAIYLEELIKKGVIIVK